MIARLVERLAVRGPGERKGLKKEGVSECLLNIMEGMNQLFTGPTANQ